MNSPLKWVGGKSKLAERIVKLIPEHKHYGEVFAGAGWVFFRKPESKYESINDINSDLVTFYRVLKHHLQAFVEEFRWLLTSRECFNDFKKQQVAGGLTDIQRAARFYYLQRNAFGGQVVGQTFGVSPQRLPAINLLRIEEELSSIHLRLSRVVVENLSWEDYLDRYDRPDTFFYLDPPYWGTEDYYGKDFFKREDFVRLAKHLDAIKGQFLLSLNDCPEVRDTFSAFDIRCAETIYSCSRAESQKAGEVLIMNYVPKPGLLKFCD